VSNLIHRYEKMKDKIFNLCLDYPKVVASTTAGQWRSQEDISVIMNILISGYISRFKPEILEP